MKWMTMGRRAAFSLATTLSCATPRQLSPLTLEILRAPTATCVLAGGWVVGLVVVGGGGGDVKLPTAIGLVLLACVRS